MRLRRLHVSGFRGFADATLAFEDDLTVLVGINGSGKSSLLDAVVHLLSFALLRPMRGMEWDCVLLRDEDVRVGSSRAEIHLETLHEGMNVTWTVGHSVHGQLESDAPHAWIWPTGAALPAFIVYPAGRVTAAGSASFQSVVGEQDARGALYRDWLSAPRTGFASFFRWFKDREDLENEQKVAHSDLSHRDPHLTAVRTAVERMLPGFGGLRVQRDPLHLVVRKGQTTLALDQLSEGERDLLVMVADLARRLAVAHPTLANPLDGEAVVLIDEVELHLHPAWQQRIAGALRATFPSVQFVVTTHAPLVIGEVPARCVRLLKDFHVEAAPVATEGRDISRIVQFLMGVTARPTVIEDLFVGLRQCIDDEHWDAAWSAVDALRGRLGDDDPDVSAYAATLPPRDGAHAAE